MFRGILNKSIPLSLTGILPQTPFSSPRETEGQEITIGFNFYFTKVCGANSLIQKE